MINFRIDCCVSYQMRDGSGPGARRAAAVARRFAETSVARTSSGRMPRVRIVTADDVQSAIERLEAVQGELAAVVELMRQRKLKQLSLTGWGKYERAMQLLKQFTAHTEFSLKTA